MILDGRKVLVEGYTSLVGDGSDMTTIFINRE